jgi:dihydrofolate synthase/folylpolyglutamate synthase
MTSPFPATPALERALACLYRRNLHTVRLGLEPTVALLDALGRPQDHFLALHVAGTNGKGSVAALLAAALQACGLRTGLYTSPHLVRFAERIRVEDEPISDTALAELIDQVDAQAAAAQPQIGRDVTFFEFTTALAFALFRRAGVQVAVIEVGMGGRLDATNVVDPLACAITSIGFDHMAYLGNTIEQIAAEKAGIIKPGRAVVCGDLPPAALAVVRSRAAALGSPVIVAGDAVAVRRTKQTLAGQRLAIEGSDTPYGPLTLPLLGAHQLGNVAVALALLEHIRDTFQLPITRTGVEQGFARVRWPARFQVLEQDPPVLLDGAHNPQAARVLRQTLDELLPDRPLALVFGFLGDKDAVGFLRELSGRTRRSWAVALEGERALPLDQVVAAGRTAGLDPTPAALDRAVTDATRWARENGGVVCITGSLYLAGAELARRGLVP